MEKLKLQKKVLLKISYDGIRNCFGGQRMFFCLEGGNKLDGWDDSIAAIEFYFGSSMFTVRGIFHEPKMLPIIVVAGFWVADSKIGIQSDAF